MRNLYLCLMLIGLSSLTFIPSSAMDQPSSPPKKVKNMKMPKKPITLEIDPWWEKEEKKEQKNSFPPSEGEDGNVRETEEYVDARIPQKYLPYTGAESQTLAPLEKRETFKNLKQMNNDLIKKFKKPVPMKEPLAGPMPAEDLPYTGTESQTLAPMEKRNKLEKPRTMNDQNNIQDEREKDKRSNVQQKRDFWEKFAKQQAE